jgi:hypothetical protein
MHALLIPAMQLRDAFMQPSPARQIRATRDHATQQQDVLRPLWFVVLVTSVPRIHAATRQDALPPSTRAMIITCAQLTPAMLPPVAQTYQKTATTGIPALPIYVC